MRSSRIKTGAIIAALIVAGVIACELVLPFHKTRTNVRYDAFLGWSNIAGYYDQNGFGKNAYIRINAQGFRNNSNFDVQVPKGKKRIICSGDSFTFGHGVSNDEVWCELLTRIDGSLEAINMGQRAYGIDQAYLWYMRDGIKFDHQVQVFGIIYDNFNRFGSRFNGYNKPFLVLDQGKLLVKNVPVPYALRFIRVARKMRSRFEPHSPEDIEKQSMSRQITLTILENLKKINQGKRSRLVVVYFPTYYTDFHKDPDRAIRDFLSGELKQRDIDFLDLTEDFGKLPEDQRKRAYMNKDGKGWHYSPFGNRLVADLIYKHLSPVLSGMEK